MRNLLDKTIFVLFCLLFFLVPIVFFPKTSELFEFNKMVFTYTIATLITSAWVVKMIFVRKVIFRRTSLDIPILIFVASQILATIFSIDFRNSLLGYYSRFHGGLLSTIAYALLYWVYVSNIDKNQTLKIIKTALFSALLVSTWAILEHFGKSPSCSIVALIQEQNLGPAIRNFSTDCWVQDVKTRVFASLGQPNWLAAWITALMPIAWTFALNSKFKKKNEKLQFKRPSFWLWLTLSVLFFLTLLYTKSRSGILGFVFSYLIFWSLTLWSTLKYDISKLKGTIKKFIIFNLATLILILLVGSPWTPKFSELLNVPTTNYQLQSTNSGPALETGGTESGEIRKIVWKGAFDIWKHYPIFGSGVETFAFAYYKFRPVEHNLVSEWDYLYNKAHNEYLNYLATTGLIGLSSYLILILFAIKQMIYDLRFTNNEFHFKNHISLFAGFASILVTNFFGFSVVPVAILFFLYPAMTVALEKSDKSKDISDKMKLSIFQKSAIALVLLVTCYLLLITYRYWWADYFYNQGKTQNSIGDYQMSQKSLEKAINLSPSESIFWDELSESSSRLALFFFEEHQDDFTQTFLEKSVTESQKAKSLSPNNVNIIRNQANLFIRLASIDPNLLKSANTVLTSAVKLAPTDAKLFYNLALSYLRIGDTQKSIEIMQKTVSMKSNYKDAHYALALLYINDGQLDKAKEELNYILDFLDPYDEETKRELREISR